MFTYLFDGLLRRVFSLLRVDGIYLCISLWLEGIKFLFLSKILSIFFTRSLVRDSPPSVHDDLCSKNSSSPGVWHEIHSPRPLSQNWFSYSLFPLMEEGGYFRFGILANHLASIFFLPPSGDLLGLLYVPVPHSLPIRSQSTNICWFPFWPGFVTWGIDLDSSFNGQSLAC